MRSSPVRFCTGAADRHRCSSIRSSRKRSVGAEPGFDFSYIWRGKTEVAHGLALGSMGFGRITNIAGSGPSMQDHRVGPALFLEAEIEPGRHVEIGIGAFAGIGRDSPDASVMFNVGVPLVPGRH